jgi:hypothetical protein
MKRGVLYFGLVGLFVGILFPTASASEISPETSKMAVQAWIDEGSSLGKLTGARAESAVTLTNDVSGARLHVVTLAGGGYVVTSADDLVTPVLAFSSSGTTLVPDERNPLWSLLKGDISARESAAGIVRVTNADLKTQIRATALAATASVSAPAPTPSQQRWASLLSRYAASTATVTRTVMLMSVASIPSGSKLDDLRVDAFVQSRWDQGTHNGLPTGANCYNRFTPNNYVCGCTATAIAQLMRYWQYPTVAVTSQTHTCSVDGTPVEKTTSGGIYNWANMPLVPAAGVTDEQCEAIGQLTYDIGISVGMDWGIGGSSSSLFAGLLRLRDLFCYSNAVGVYYDQDYVPYSIESLKSIVIPNCDARSPMCMSIQGTGVGHAVLVDGYGYSGGDYFYIHLNCGWGGTSDAWYCPPEISTAGGNFTAIDGFVFNVFPQKTGSIVSGRVLDAAGGPIANAAVSLKSGSSVVETTTTDQNGIYAFIAEEGSYVIEASPGGSPSTLPIDVNNTSGTRFYETEEGVFYCQDPVTIGNSFTNDLRISSIAGVAKPAISPESCLFYPSTNVTISCATEGATIHYTTSGADPTVSSPEYSGPITIYDDTTLKARAFKAGMNPSAVASMIYTYDSDQGAPKGDYYDNPIDISEASGSRVIDDNSSYTLEDDEAFHTLEGGSYFNMYRSVWFRWTAPGGGTMTFVTASTIGANLIPTAVAVYPDEVSLPTSTAGRLAMSKDYQSRGDGSTAVALSVTQGVTYRIVGVQLNSMSGNFSFSWFGDLTVAPTATSGTDVPVPYSWLDTYYPGTGKTGTVYEEQGISDTDGDGFPAWQEYAANSDPTNAASHLTCSIEIGADGKPVLSVAPAAARDGFPRIWQGKADLSDPEWGATNVNSRFFRVHIE